MGRLAPIVMALFAVSPAHAGEIASAELARGEITDQTSQGWLFEAGSIAKFACTLAILRLSDRGALTLDDPVGWYLPALADAPAASVSLRHALANRSGIADGLMPALRTDPVAVMAISDASEAASRFAGGVLANEPDSEWSYDLVNWIIVQGVIENVTREPLDRALDRLVLKPAGMRRSRVFKGASLDDVAPPAEPSRPLPRFLQCAGGLASTPTDLIALARFPHKGGLSQRSLDALTTITTPDQGYTLGGRYRTTDPRGLVSWQSGSNGAYKSLVVYDPASDTGFAAMTASGKDELIHAARAEWLAR